MCRTFENGKLNTGQRVKEIVIGRHPLAEVDGLKPLLTPVEHLSHTDKGAPPRAITLWEGALANSASHHTPELMGLKSELSLRGVYPSYCIGVARLQPTASQEMGQFNFGLHRQLYTPMRARLSHRGCPTKKRLCISNG
jgi:hypothetical protein